MVSQFPAILGILRFHSYGTLDRLQKELAALQQGDKPAAPGPSSATPLEYRMLSADIHIAIGRRASVAICTNPTSNPAYRTVYLAWLPHVNPERPAVDAMLHETVTPEDVAKVVSKWTGARRYFQAGLRCKASCP